MVKEKRILTYFIGWLFIGFLIMSIGVSNVFADELERIGYLSDITDVQVVVPYNDAPLTLQRNGEYYLDDVDNLLIYVNNYTFYKDVIYQLEILLPNSNLTNADIFTVTGFNSTNDNVSCRAIKIITDDLQYVNFRWSCQEDINGLTINVKNSKNENIVKPGIFRWNYTYLLEVTSTTDNSDIINGLDNIQQSIVDSNKETQEVIKDQLNSCRDSINLAYNAYYQSTNTNYAYLVQVLETNIIEGKTYTISVYIDADENTRAYWNGNNGYFDSLAFDVKPGLNRYSYTFNAKKSGTVLSTVLSKSGTSDDIFLTPSKIQIQEGNIATKYEAPNTQICTNKIDETNDKLDGIQGALTDSSAPNTSGLQNSAGWLPAGPLDSILNLPLTMLNSLTNSLGKTCSPLNLTLPYVNKNIQIPCLSAIFAQITGVNGLWTWVGTISSVLILYNYLLNLYAWVDRVLTLRAEFDEAMGADLANWGRL